MGRKTIEEGDAIIDHGHGRGKLAMEVIGQVHEKSEFKIIVIGEIDTVR